MCALTMILKQDWLDMLQPLVTGFGGLSLLTQAIESAGFWIRANTRVTPCWLGVGLLTNDRITALRFDCCAYVCFLLMLFYAILHRTFGKCAIKINNYRETPTKYMQEAAGNIYRPHHQ